MVDQYGTDSDDDHREHDDHNVSSLHVAMVLR